jgi:hypothetical protein
VNTDLERSPFLRGQAYRYIRQADHLPDFPVDGGGGGDPVARVRLFNPTGVGTWFICEYDPTTHMAFGLSVLHEAEVGYISMEELTAYRGRFGLPIERDLHFKPCRLSECQQGGGR